jgi:hypothetical protein
MLVVRYVERVREIVRCDELYGDCALAVDAMGVGSCCRYVAGRPARMRYSGGGDYGRGARGGAWVGTEEGFDG